MLPSMTSEWPPAYFVSAWIDTSTPWRNGWKKCSPQVLSMNTLAPRACAARAMAGMSCTSNVMLPGLSVYTTRVFGRISAAMPASSTAGS